MDVGEETIEEVIGWGKSCLVGKLLIDRRIGKAGDHKVYAYKRLEIGEASLFHCFGR